MSTESPLLRAARREPVDRTPVWFMRQAGRVLPEYRKVRETLTLLQISERPEVCAEVTLQPMRRIDYDAAILFADIMTPLVGIGVRLDIVDGVGPVIEQPIRTAAAAGALRAIDPAADVPYVLESIGLIRRALPADKALIGFAGAPFTLASYLIEGRGTRDFLKTKALMYGEAATWHLLMDRLTGVVTEYLRAQVAAGADALQLFDSWVGALDAADYAEYVEGYTRRIFAALRPLGVPLIHFGVNTATLLGRMAEDGGTVIGADWRIPLDEAWARVGHDKAIQGNLDPAALLGPPAVIEAKIADVLARAAGRPGHIFNLGHGLHPSTPVDHVRRAVDAVHELSARAGATDA